MGGSRLELEGQLPGRQYFFFFYSLGIEILASNMQGKHSTK